MLEQRSKYVKMMVMATSMKRAARRGDVLSKQRIVEAAIEILDAEGEHALTFRTLAARLATGSGAIYYRVAGKDELLAAATEIIIGRAVIRGPRETEPREAIRAIALGVFDAIEAHPWAGTHLAREPWQPATGAIIEGVGGQLQSLGVPEQAQFNCASALVNYILGRAAHYAAAARLLPCDTDRQAFLASVIERWTQDEPTGYPFIRQVAAQLQEHDDREQFLAGVDLILAGVQSCRTRDSR